MPGHDEFSSARARRVALLAPSLEQHSDPTRPADPTALFDPVEEPFDVIASAIEVRAKADRIAAVAFWRDIGPRTLLHRKLSDPVGVIATVGKQHLSGFETREQFSGESNVVGLAGAQRQPYRQTIAIDHRVDFARQAAA